MKNFIDYKIYMFEGCDRTGKSTFIDFLKTTLIEKGYHPFVFHLMGPPKFNGDFVLDNDEKSLAQLSKFNDEYDLIREMLNTDDKCKIILDRTSFGEYIWTKYWQRHGMFTDYTTSSQFIEQHRDLMDESIYIDFWMSDIYKLTRRIEESPEDTKIFTIEERSIEANIKYVYAMYEDLAKIIKDNKIDYMKIDASKFSTPDDDLVYINSLCK